MNKGSVEFEARILQELGNAQQALVTNGVVLEQQATNPSVGPEHPDTLRSKVILTMITALFDRTEEEPFC